jgi:hypothetical protein
MKVATTLLIDEILLERAKQRFGKRKLSETVNALLEVELRGKTRRKDAGGILRKFKLKPFVRDEDREL